MLFGEPPVVWDRFAVHAYRQGVAVRVGREAPPPHRPVGYKNIVLESDRVVEIAKRMPGATHAEIGRAAGISANWAGDLLRIARLPDEIKTYVRALGPYVRQSQVTGIDLRRLLLLRDSQKQLASFHTLLRKRGLAPMAARR